MHIHNVDFRIVTCMAAFAASIVMTCDTHSRDVLRSKEEIARIYREVAAGRPFSVRGVSAELSIDGERWLVVGAEQESSARYKPTPWRTSIGDGYALFVVENPISNEYILPFSDPVPNAITSDVISIAASRNGIEPGSFVLRSGENTLRNVRVDVGTLRGEKTGAVIHPANIDIRGVKCWFQAGGTVNRRVDGTKRLVPELLLHDLGLVSVDYERQVNLIRDPTSIRDANAFVPYDQPPFFNQQFWISVTVEDQPADTYSGVVSLTFDLDGEQRDVTIRLSVEVLDVDLPKPIIDYAMFYRGQLSRSDRVPVSTDIKSEELLLADFKDMKAHGLTNIAIEDHIDPRAVEQNEKIRRTIAVMRAAGFDNDRFLYVDWKMRGSHSASAYTSKIQRLRKIVETSGMTELFVYNLDEQPGDVLLRGRKTFEIVHDNNAKNVVATTPEAIHKLEGLLDGIVLHRKNWAATDAARAASMVPFAYNNPQAGEEKPATYRELYGIRLWAEGFDAVCQYAYQTSGDSGRTGWDDWARPMFRPHIMAYPSLSGPIPTVQWEGWREGVDDVRYLTAVLKREDVLTLAPSIGEREKILDRIGVSKSMRPDELRRIIANRLVRSSAN